MSIDMALFPILSIAVLFFQFLFSLVEVRFRWVVKIVVIYERSGGVCLKKLELISSRTLTDFARAGALVA